MFRDVLNRGEGDFPDIYKWAYWHIYDPQKTYEGNVYYDRD